MDEILNLIESVSEGFPSYSFIEVYAQSVSADCDFDFCSSDMVLARDTSSYHDYHLCPIIFKSHHVRLSYGPDMVLEHTHGHFTHFMAGA